MMHHNSGFLADTGLAYLQDETTKAFEYFFFCNLAAYIRPLKITTPDQVA